MRTIAPCGLAVLLVVAGGAWADDTRPAPKIRALSGTFDSYKDGVLTVKVTDRTQPFGPPKSQDFTIEPTTPVVLGVGADKKTLMGGEAFKDLTKDVIVAVTLEDNKVIAVAVVPLLPAKKNK